MQWADAVEAYHEEVERLSTCEWCGEKATEDNPVIEALLTPPVSGYEIVFSMVHKKKCMAAASLAMVE